MYVIRAQTGEETEVCKILREKHLYPILPSKIMYIRRFGKWRKEEQILMPGYIFLKKNEITAREYYRIKSIPGVIGILGTDGKLSALPKNEESFIDLLNNGGAPIEPVKITNVPAVVINGRSFRILKIFKRQKRVRIYIDIFGKEHNIDIAAEIV